MHRVPFWTAVRIRMRAMLPLVEKLHWEARLAGSLEHKLGFQKVEVGGDISA